MKYLWLVVVPVVLTKANIISPQLETRDELAFSEPYYPSPWMDPQANGWQEAYAQARDLVSQLTLLEKVNITTGVRSVPTIPVMK